MGGMSISLGFCLKSDDQYDILTALLIGVLITSRTFPMNSMHTGASHQLMVYKDTPKTQPLWVVQAHGLIYNGL